MGLSQHTEVRHDIQSLSKGLKLSGLGLGCMRLPVLDGDEARVDYARAEQIIDYAYAHGVNYFDTAYALSRREQRGGH